MDITAKNLRLFQDWFLQRGRSPGTAELYAINITKCAADPKGLTNRLIAGRLAPNTLRANVAALRAWALYTEDAALAKRLSDIRLPPARRVRVKLPLDAENWRKVVKDLQSCPMNCEAMRQVLLILAIRGFRSGDVLRLRKVEVERALATGRLVYEVKGRKRIEVLAAPIRPQLEALAAMPKWDRVRDLISSSTNHRVLSKRVCRAAKRAAKRVGIPDMNPHRFRHTFATNYLNKLKGDPNAIIKLQKYMGWESMATAARYVDQVNQDELDTIGAGLVSGLLE